MSIRHKIIVATVLAAALWTPAGAAEPGEASGGYEYPVAWGSEAWKALDNPGKFKVSNIPEDVMAEMTTPELAEACMANPMLHNLVAVENYVKSMDILVDGLNCLQELERRPDAGSVMLGRYQRTEIVDPAAETPLDRALHKQRLMLMEMILMRPAVLANMSEATAQDLLRTCVDRSGERCAHRIKGADVNSILTGRVLTRLQAEKSMQAFAGQTEIRQFLAGDRPFDDEYAQTIFDQASEYLKNH